MRLTVRRRTGVGAKPPPAAANKYGGTGRRLAIKRSFRWGRRHHGRERGGPRLDLHNPSTEDRRRPEGRSGFRSTPYRTTSSIGPWIASSWLRRMIDWRGDFAAVAQVSFWH